MEKFNVYKRKDGRWEGGISRGKKANGKRDFKCFFAKTKEKVCEMMRDFRIKEAQKGDCTKLFSTVFSEWYNIVKHNVKDSTAANYSMKATKHILPSFGEKNISDISANDVYDFIELKQKDGLSNRYISDIIILMKTFFKYAVRTYHIFNPMDGVTLPKKKAPEIHLLDESEQKKLQEYISNNHNRTTLGIALSTTTGIRIGELCGLQWQDIDLEKRILTVSGLLIQCL